MTHRDKVLDLIYQLKIEVEQMADEIGNLETQNTELLQALSKFTSCLQVSHKNRRKDDPK
jgi:division protein CdvB (Snf7/Vps24/ESCRT-III family)